MTGAVSGQTTFLRRLFCYLLGTALLALGVSLSVKSGLGTSPVSSLPYTLSLLLEMDMGLLTALVFTFYVLLQMAILGRAFQAKSFLQIVAGVIFGGFVSFINRLLLFETPERYTLKLALIFAGILFVGSGIFVIMSSKFFPQPPEGLMWSIHVRTGWNFGAIKVGFDLTVVAVAALLSVIFTRKLAGVREGTLLAAWLVGVVVGVLRKRFGAKLEGYLGTGVKTS